MPDSGPLFAARKRVEFSTLVVDRSSRLSEILAEVGLDEIGVLWMGVERLLLGLGADAHNIIDLHLNRSQCGEA